VVLTLLAILIAALVALAVAAAFVPRAAVTFGSACLAGLVVLLALAAVAGFEAPAVLALPFGPAGVTMRLALDPLGACFLLLVFVGAAPSVLFADVDPDAAAASRASLPASLAAMALSVLAADPFTLVLGLLLLGFAGGRNQSSVRLTIFGVVCLIAALALAAPRSVGWLDCDFATIRATPPDGWHAGAVLVLVLLGTASQAGLLRRAAIPATAATTVWIYVLIRVVLDLCGPAQPLWWGVPLLLLGAIAAVVGTLRAAIETSLQSVLSIGSLHQLGLSIIGLGVALLARSVDLPGVALVALEAVWLLLVCHLLCRTLLLLCACAVETGAGTRRLDRMGGLIHRMPVSATCTLVGLFGVAVLPLGLGFAGFWLLFQSLLAAARIGSIGLQLVIVFVAALVALSIGLAAFAAVRLFAVAFLGRPRTPRTAVAEEAAKPLRAALIGLAALTGLLGLAPTLALLPASRALAHLANGGADAIAFALPLRSGAEAPGYPPLVLAALLVLAGCALFWRLRRAGSPGIRREAAWSGGFAPPPAWLPFGDPATQYGPVSFAEPLHQAMGSQLAMPDASALRAKFVGRRRKLLNAAKSLGDADVSRSVAAVLVVLGLAMVAWLVMP